MARVVEQRHPDTVIINDRDRGPANNTGLIVATIAIIILLLLVFFASRLIGSGGGSTNINVRAPSSTPTVTAPSR